MNMNTEILKNITTYENKHTQWPSRINLRNAKLVQHMKINSCNTLSVETNIPHDQTLIPIHDLKKQNLQKLGIEGKSAQSDKEHL